VSEPKSPRDRLLDLLVFGPAGLALTAAEEFPKLVEKGRHRVEGQVHTARLVGQFAVQMGRQQLEQTLGSLRPDRPASTSPGSDVYDSDVHEGDVHESDVAAPAPPSAPVAPPPPPSVNGTMASDVLAIPGYDSLSASQVVQRLGGLSAGELEAVRVHELGHRHRRTILGRVDQLLAGPGDVPG